MGLWWWWWVVDLVVFMGCVCGLCSQWWWVVPSHYCGRLLLVVVVVWVFFFCWLSLGFFVAGFVGLLNFGFFMCDFGWFLR